MTNVIDMSKYLVVEEEDVTMPLDKILDYKDFILKSQMYWDHLDPEDKEDAAKVMMAMTTILIDDFVVPYLEQQEKDTDD